MTILGPNGQKISPESTNAEMINSSPSEAFMGATAADIKAMPAEAMGGMRAEHMNYMNHESMSGIRSEQIREMPPSPPSWRNWWSSASCER